MNKEGSLRKDFMKRSAILTIFIALLVINTTVAFADVRFKPREPLFTRSGLTLTASGALAGLGNEDVTVILNATGTPTTRCTNKDGSEAPGQNPANVSLSGSTNIPASQIKNRKLLFSVTTAAPLKLTAAEAGCPTSNWTPKIADVELTSASVTVIQGGLTVLQKNFKF